MNSELLKTLIRTPLSPKELQDLWKANTRTKGKPPKIVLYDNIIKARSLNTIFGKQDAIIIFYPNFQRGGTTSGHYVTLIRNKALKTIYFFDSYGKLPDVGQKKYAMDREALYDEKHNSLIDLLLKKGWNVDYNHVPLQSSNPEVATCGRWGLLRVLWKHLTNDQFVQAIKHWCDKLNVDPDTFVTMMFN